MLIYPNQMLLLSAMHITINKWIKIDIFLSTFTTLLLCIENFILRPPEIELLFTFLFEKSLCGMWWLFVSFFCCWKYRKLFFYTSKKLNKFFSYLWLLIEHWKTPKLDVPLYNFDSKRVQKTISRVWVHIIGGLIFGRSTIIYSVLIAFLLLHSEQSFPISYFFPCRYCPNFTW